MHPWADVFRRAWGVQPPAVRYVNGVVGACPEQAYHRICPPAPDRQSCTAAPAVGVADIKTKVLDAQLRGKCPGFLKDWRRINLIDGAPAALFKVRAVEALGRVERCSACGWMKCRCGEPPLVQ